MTTINAVTDDAYTKAWWIVLDTPADERPGLDEWFECDGMDVNVVGSDYSDKAPANGAIVVVYPCRIPESGMFPRHLMTFLVDVDARDRIIQKAIEDAYHD